MEFGASSTRRAARLCRATPRTGRIQCISLGTGSSALSSEAIHRAFEVVVRLAEELIHAVPPQLLGIWSSSNRAWNEELVAVESSVFVAIVEVGPHSIADHPPQVLVDSSVPGVKNTVDVAA